MRFLAWLFPPRLKGKWAAPEALVRKDGDVPEVVGDGILWVGYDVKMTGIERMAMWEREASFREYPAC